jgi:hypothetical protein
MHANVKNSKQWMIRTILVTVFGFLSACSFAQTDSLPGDPGALVVYTVQNLSFGAFTNSGGSGSVIIGANGSRTVTGGVVALNLGVSAFQSIFEIDAPYGSVISLLNGPNATLTGSNGGSMMFTIGASNPASPLITTVHQPARTTVNIGGTLTVGSPAANPPGAYSGTFYITFNYE